MDIASTTGLLTALAALVLAAITRSQLKHSRFALGVDLVLSLEDRFDAPDFQRQRAKAAAALLNSADLDNVEPVLDFFETLGLLLRRRAVDPELVWSSFAHWILRYGALAQPTIQARRRRDADATYYSLFDELLHAMRHVEAKKRGLTTPPTFAGDQLSAFLRDEVSLATPSPPAAEAS